MELAFDYRCRGWLVMSLISIALLLVVALPMAYEYDERDRTIFVAVMMPCMLILYMIAFYFIIYRPLLRCGEILNAERICNESRSAVHPSGQHAAQTPMDTSVQIWTKELAQLNNAIALLCAECDRMHNSVSPALQAPVRREAESYPREEGIEMAAVPAATPKQDKGAEENLPVFSNPNGDNGRSSSPPFDPLTYSPPTSSILKPPSSSSSAAKAHPVRSHLEIHEPFDRTTGPQ